MRLSEIDYSAGSDAISATVLSTILNNSKVIGDFENRPVYFLNLQGHDIYSYMSDGTIDAVVFLVNGNLRGIKNYTNTGGLVTALVGFITHVLKKKITIGNDEPLTPSGFKWLYKLLSASGRGLTIRDQTGEFPDKYVVKAEWEKAMRSDTHGPTVIIIESNMQRAFKTIKQFRERLMPMYFYIGDETIL